MLGSWRFGEFGSCEEEMHGSKIMYKAGSHLPPVPSPIAERNCYHEQLHHRSQYECWARQRLLLTAEPTTVMAFADHAASHR